MVLIENDKEHMVTKTEQITSDISFLVFRLCGQGNCGFHLIDALWA